MGTSASKPVPGEDPLLALKRDLKAATDFNARLRFHLESENAVVAGAFKRGLESFTSRRVRGDDEQPRLAEPVVFAEGSRTLVVDEQQPGGFALVLSSSVAAGISAARADYEPEYEYHGCPLPVHVKHVPTADDVPSIPLPGSSSSSKAGGHLFDLGLSIDVGILAALTAKAQTQGEQPSRRADYADFEIAEAAGTIGTGCWGLCPGSDAGVAPTRLLRVCGDRAWQTDAYFVEQRTLGVNPCAMRRFSTLSQDAQEEVARLFAAGGAPLPLVEGSDATRPLFIIDYAVLQGASASLDRAKNYVPAPILALGLAEDGRALEPVAAVLDRAVLEAGGTPTAVPRGDTAKWRFAKLCIGAADWTVHELGSHLTLTHFVSEVLALATYRELPRGHPVYQLLAPHFHKTLPLNDGARAALVPQLIVGHHGTPFSEAQAWGLCNAVFRSWDYAAHYVPVELAARGVQALPAAAYPYARTAMTVWTTTRAYVAKVITAASAAATAGGAAPGTPLVASDERLAAWVAQLRDPAWMPSFPDIRDDEALVDALTMAIYNASHQHAAVNYFQEKYLSFGPAAPTHIQRFPAAAELEGLQDKDLPALLPLPSIAALAAGVAVMLSSEPHTSERLCDFTAFNSETGHGVKSGVLRALHAEFQTSLRAALSAVEAEVSPRFTHLTRALIAQSVLI